MIDETRSSLALQLSAVWRHSLALTLRGPVGQIYRTHLLARQRVGLDDALGRRRNPVTGGAGWSTGKKPLSTIASLRSKRGASRRKNQRQPPIGIPWLPLFGLSGGSDLGRGHISLTGANGVDPAFDCWQSRWQSVLTWTTGRSPHWADGRASKKIDRKVQHKRSPPTRLAKTMKNRAHQQLADQLWSHY